MSLLSVMMESLLVICGPVLIYQLIIDADSLQRSTKYEIKVRDWISQIFPMPFLRLKIQDSPH